MTGGNICYTEYFPVFMKQLGLTPSQIGWTSLYGMYSVASLAIGFLADKMRARKPIFAVATALSILFAVAPLLPLVAKSLENCHEVQGNCSLNQTAASGQYSPCAISPSKDNRMASLLLFVVIIRFLYETFSAAAVILQTTAILTYTKNDKASYGFFRLWSQVAAAIFLFAVGMIANYVDISICSAIQPGYYVSFPIAAIAIGLSLIAFPWVEYEYLEHRVITWNEVKAVLLDKHYIVMLLIDFYSGWCFSFQYQWEYWYIDLLSASPTVLALGGLVRRPFAALWFIISVPIINRMGDLFTIALALLSYMASQLALSFIQNPWLVLVVDIFQSLGFALSFTAILIHFSKAGSKASSAAIMGKSEQRHQVLSPRRTLVHLSPAVVIAVHGIELETLFNLVQTII